jgi:hypothetical protein
MNSTQTGSSSWCFSGTIRSHDASYRNCLYNHVLRTAERERIGMDCYGISIVVGIAIQIVSATSGTIFNVSIAGTNSPISGVVGSITGMAVVPISTTGQGILWFKAIRLQCGV